MVGREGWGVGYDDGGFVLGWGVILSSWERVMGRDGV